MYVCIYVCMYVCTYVIALYMYCMLRTTNCINHKYIKKENKCERMLITTFAHV